MNPVLFAKKVSTIPQIHYIGSNDKVMVVSYDRSLHLRQPFTSNMGDVNRALEELETLSGHATLRERERKTAIDEISGATRELTAMGAARDHAESVEAEMKFTLRGLSRQVELLSGLVGRKALLYVSDGIPQVIAEDLFIFVDERFPRARARLEAGNFDIANSYRKLIAQANSSGVTFFTLDAGGMRAGSTISAEYGGTTQGGGLPLVDSIYSANMKEPLHMIADDTGGRAIVGTNAIEAGLGKILGDLRNYYSLGYQPPRSSGGGRYYKLKVKLKQKGLKVRHRIGYRDKSVEARIAESTVASLIYGNDSNPLGIDLGFGRPRTGEETARLSVDVKIPLDKVVLIPRSGAYIGRLKVAVATMAEDGGLSEVDQQQPFMIEIPENELEIARQKYYTYQVVLENLDVGLSRVAVTVHDEHSAKASHVRRTIRIGS
ncbi:MAG: VWA domain-containing protein [Acidobacteriota bacterium]